VTVHKRQTRKEKKKKKKKLKRIIAELILDIKNTLTSVSLGSGLKMMWVLVLICCSGQFVFCPNLEDNLALQVRDLLIGFHSEA
jgi:hypothetical protein